MTATTDATPELRFRLIGQWHPIVLPDFSSDELIARYVRDLIGTRDDLATMRALVTRELRGAAGVAADGDVTAMFLMSSLTPEMPMPATLTVMDHPGLRMSPAVGVSGHAVIDVLAESLRTLDRPGIETMTRLSTSDSEILRLHRISEVAPDFGPDEMAAAPVELRTEVEQLHSRALDAEYWCTVPGSKRVVLVRLTTPMADIPNVMLGFFDSIVQASYFEMPESAEVVDGV